MTPQPSFRGDPEERDYVLEYMLRRRRESAREKVSAQLERMGPQPPFAPLDVDAAAHVGGNCRAAAEALADLHSGLARLAASDDDSDRAAYARSRAELIAREAIHSSLIENEGYGVTDGMVAEMLDAAAPHGGPSAPKGLRAGLAVHSDNQLADAAESVWRCAASTERLTRSRLTGSALLDAHRLLMGNQRRKRPGRFRSADGGTVYIGNAYEVIYVPPAGGPQIDDMTRSLLEWAAAQCRRADTSEAETDRLAVRIAAAGIAHTRYESIHPFVDGNGRTGRSLAEAMLCGSGIDVPLGVGSAFSQVAYEGAVTVSASDFAERGADSRNGYYAKLNESRDDPTLFVEWWAAMVEHAAQRAMQLMAANRTEPR